MSTLKVGTCFITRYDHRADRYRKIVKQLGDHESGYHYLVESFVVGIKQPPYTISIPRNGVNRDMNEGKIEFIDPEKYEIEKTLRAL